MGFIIYKVFLQKNFYLIIFKLLDIPLNITENTGANKRVSQTPRKQRFRRQTFYNWLDHLKKSVCSCVHYGWGLFYIRDI